MDAADVSLDRIVAGPDTVLMLCVQFRAWGVGLGVWGLGFRV